MTRQALPLLACFLLASSALAQEDPAKEAMKKLADSISIDLTKPPEPGGYMKGLTKPLMVDITTRIWGPGIQTPPPGGEWPSPNRPRPTPPKEIPQPPIATEEPKAPATWEENFAANKKTWVDVTGKFSTEAVFESLTPGGIVLIKADQTRIKIPLDKLSPDSLRLAVQLSQTQKSAP